MRLKRQEISLTEYELIVDILSAFHVNWWRVSKQQQNITLGAVVRKLIHLKIITVLPDGQILLIIAVESWVDQKVRQGNLCREGQKDFTTSCPPTPMPTLSTELQAV